MLPAIRMEKKAKWIALIYTLLAASLFLLFDGAFDHSFVKLASSLNNTPSSNYENVTVWTRINITNAKPEIIALTIDEGVAGNNITLFAGGFRPVFCNATVRDWNGMDGNITLNGTFFQQGTPPFGADDNNTHYTNASCFNTTVAFGQNGILKNYTCSFNTYYYANNGTWNCTMVALDVKDSKNYTSEGSNTTNLDRLYALNVTDGIDYGELAVGEYTSNRLVNVTNFGNVAINLSVEGYGVVPGDGWAFVCNGSVSSFNISAQYETFGLNVSANFSQKVPLTGSSQPFANITIGKQTDPSAQVVNTTVWQAYVPPSINPNGECTGNVIFAARVS